MQEVEVTEQIHIDARPEVVRKQFADVDHHAQAAVHKGVGFELVSNNDERCRYLQVTRVGPLRLKQTIELDHSSTGPLINRVVAGQFTGGTITFDVSGDASTTVQATFLAPLLGPKRVLAPLFRRNVRRALRRALLEDKNDIESGNYSSLSDPCGQSPVSQHSTGQEAT